MEAVSKIYLKLSYYLQLWRLNLDLKSFSEALVVALPEVSCSTTEPLHKRTSLEIISSRLWKNLFETKTSIIDNLDLPCFLAEVWSFIFKSRTFALIHRKGKDGDWYIYL